MALAWVASHLAEVSVIQPFAYIVPHYDSPVCLMVRNRIFLEDQPVWPYRGYPYGD